MVEVLGLEGNGADEVFGGIVEEKKFCEQGFVGLFERF